MTASTTITIRVSAEMKSKLGQLAQETRRSKSFLAAEAVAGYVARELEIVAGIQLGLADIEAGRTVPHADAAAELYAAIAAAGNKD